MAGGIRGGEREPPTGQSPAMAIKTSAADSATTR